MAKRPKDKTETIWDNKYTPYAFFIIGIGGGYLITLLSLQAGIIIGSLIVLFGIYLFIKTWVDQKVTRKNVTFIVLVILSIVIILMPILFIHQSSQSSNNTIIVNPPQINITNVLQQPNATSLTIEVKGALVVNKMLNKNYFPEFPNSNSRFIFPDLFPPIPQELYDDNSIIAVNYNYYSQSPMPINTVQLSIDNKIIESPPSIFKEARPEYINWPYSWFLYFKYDGIIKSGNYSNCKIIVTSGNDKFVSKPFDIQITDPIKLEP
jgi:hypothetical protein